MTQTVERNKQEQWHKTNKNSGIIQIRTKE